MNNPQPLMEADGRTTFKNCLIALLPLRFRHTPNGFHFVSTSPYCLIDRWMLDVRCSMFDVGCSMLDAQGGRAVSALAQRRDAVATLHTPAFRAFRVFRGQKNDVPHQEAFA